MGRGTIIGTGSVSAHTGDHIAVTTQCERGFCMFTIEKGTKIMNKTLCVIRSPIMVELLDKAKQSLMESDPNFRFGVAQAQPENRHASIVVRIVLSNMLTRINEITLDQWREFTELYQQHRQSVTLEQSHLRIMESGDSQISEIQQYILNHPEIYEIMAVKVAGIQLPSSLVIVCALALQTLDCVRVGDVTY